MTETAAVRPASSVKAKVVRGSVHALGVVLGMTLAGFLGKNPEYGAVAPVILGPLGGWLRDKFPQYANFIPF